jgi:hypothetical protein
MGAVLGAMASVLLGAAFLSQVYRYEVLGIVLACGSFALSGLAVAISVAIRPPGLLRPGTSTVASTPRSAAAAPARRPRLVSLPNIVLGGVALLIVLSALGSASLEAFQVRGSGNVASRVLDDARFDQVSVEGIDQLSVRQGDRSRIVVSGDSNLIDYVTVDIIDGLLHVVFDPLLSTPVRTDAPLSVEVVVPGLTSVRVGDGVRSAIDLASVGALRIVATGDSQVAIQVGRGDEVAIVGRDDSRILLRGSMTRVITSLEDDAALDAADVDPGSAMLMASGSSAIEIGLAGELAWQQSGIASIVYESGAIVDPTSLAERPDLVALADEDVIASQR